MRLLDYDNLNVYTHTLVVYKKKGNPPAKNNHFSFYYFLNFFIPLVLKMSQATGNYNPKEGVSSPYMSNDPNSNVNNFKIIESTLRGNDNIIFEKQFLWLITKS